MPNERQFVEPGPIPGAVHGKYVPGLPWDTLPPPVWEPEPVEGEPGEPDLVDPLEKEILEAAEELGEAEEEQEAAEERADDLRRDLEVLVDRFAKTNPKRAKEIREEFDLL